LDKQLQGIKVFFVVVVLLLNNFQLSHYKTIEGFCNFHTCHPSPPGHQLCILGLLFGISSFLSNFLLAEIFWLKITENHGSK
jgi:hypothetical protein